MSDAWTPRRPRPVAEAPIGALADRAEDLAKQWLIALVAAAPLDVAATMPMATLARDAPALCAAVVRALGSDHELDRLGPGGDMHPLAARAGQMAGARDPAYAVAAIEALRGVVWRASVGFEGQPEPEQVGALAERLGHVCSALIQAVLSTAGESPRPRSRPDAVGEPSPVGGPAAEGGPPEASPPPEPFVEPDLEGPMSLRDIRPRPRERAAPGPSWMGAIERRLERHEREGAPFAALLIEADGVERLLVAETGREVATAIEAVERAISEELRPADTLVRESLGRYWLLAPDTNATGARTLAERVGEVVSQRASHRGAPLTVSIGVVVCPDDGIDADELAGQAEERLLAARAGGTGPVTSVADLPG